MLGKKAKTAKLIQELHIEIAALRYDKMALEKCIDYLYKELADKDSKKDIKENKCVGNKCSEKTQQSKKKTVKTQTVANGKGKGRSGVKDVSKKQGIKKSK